VVNHKKIASLVEERGLVQKELADEVGVSEAMMSYILRGFKEPSVATLVRLAKALGCSVDALIITE